MKIGKDIQLTVHGDRVQLDVINPKREKSGVYKVIMKNAQGQDEKLINVNIMDVPTPPLNVYVDTVYQVRKNPFRPFEHLGKTMCNVCNSD